VLITHNERDWEGLKRSFRSLFLYLGVPAPTAPIPTVPIPAMHTTTTSTHPHNAHKGRRYISGGPTHPASKPRRTPPGRPQGSPLPGTEMRLLACNGPAAPCQGDHKGRPRGINLRPRSSTSVGARVDEGRMGGPLWSPASPGFGDFMVVERRTKGRRATPFKSNGRPSRPSQPIPTTLAPTDTPASCRSPGLG